MNPATFSGNMTFNSTVIFNFHYGPTHETGETMPVEAKDAVDYLDVLQTSQEAYTKHRGKLHIYQIQYHPKGRVLLINNSFEGTGRERLGGSMDVDTLFQLWRGLGCHVQFEHDLTAAKMLRAVENFVDSKAEMDFCVVIIMSHGKQDDMIIGTDSAKVHVRKIIDTVAECPALDDKPKLIFFQMCRGPQLQRSHEDADSDVFDTEESTWIMDTLTNSLRDGKILGAPVTDVEEPAEEHIAERPDIMLAFGTQPDHKSFRNQKKGSWFIQSIANIFSKQAKDNHVEELMENVKEEVEKFTAYAPRRDHHECVATVDASHTFGKHLYLFPGYPIPHKE